MLRRRVPGLAGVDDDHGSPLPAELERGREASGRSADDGDVAVSFDAAGGVFAHAPDGTVLVLVCKRPCRIRVIRPSSS